MTQDLLQTQRGADLAHEVVSCERVPQEMTREARAAGRDAGPLHDFLELVDRPGIPVCVHEKPQAGRLKKLRPEVLPGFPDWFAI